MITIASSSALKDMTRRPMSIHDLGHNEVNNGQPNTHLCTIGLDSREIRSDLADLVLRRLCSTCDDSPTKVGGEQPLPFVLSSELHIILHYVFIYNLVYLYVLNTYNACVHIVFDDLQRE